MKLGERLRRVRLECKLTQRELAGKDFTAPFISQVEKGLTVPSLKALIILANRLGYAPGYFLESKPENERNRIEILLNLGRGFLVLEDREEALARFREALKLAQDLGDNLRQARARYHIGLAHAAGEDREHGREEFTAALEAFERLDDPRGLARASFQLGLLHQQAGNLKGAVQAYQRALETLERVYDPVLAIKVRANLGAAYLSLDESEQGVALVREAAGRAEDVADPASLGRAHLRGTLARWEEGDVERALAESRRAWQVLQSLELTRTAARIQGNMGAVAAGQGRWEDAGGHFARSLELSRHIGDRRGEAHALTELACYHQQRGEPGLALEHGRKALAMASELESEAGQARAHFILGGICRQNGSPQEALGHLLASVETYEGLGQSRELANCYYELGELLLSQDRKEESLEHFQKSASLLRRTGGGRRAEPDPGDSARRGNSLHLIS